MEVTYDIVSVGEALIDLFADGVGHPLAEVTTFHRVPGGAPANVAVAAARLGARSAFIGKVGDDAFGHYLVNEMAAYGVDTRGMRFDAGARTCLNFQSWLDEHTSELLFYRNPSADMRLQPDDLDDALLRQTRAFACSSISLSAQPSRDATYAALHIAREGGAMILFDANYRPPLWPDQRTALEEIRAMIGLADVLKVNQDELLLLTGSDDPARGLRALHEMGPALCVATLGPDGSYYHHAGGGASVPGFAVTPIDTTGSGDSFTATLIVQLVGGGSSWRERLTASSLHAILHRANAAGAFTARTRGVFPALPTATALDQFMQQ